jgi:clan AA aspartic protease
MNTQLMIHNPVPFSKKKDKNYMGEVNIAVKLTNTLDEALANRKGLAKSKIRSLVDVGIVDTGAIALILPKRVADHLGLRRAGKQIAVYANGASEEVDVTEPVTVEILGRKTVEEAMVLGDDILIGQTVLEKTDFVVDCRERRLVPRHPEGAVFNVRTPRLRRVEPFPVPDPQTEKKSSKKQK